MIGESIPVLEGSLTAFILLVVFLIGVVVVRPGLTRHRGGKILIFTIFFVMPVLALYAGTTTHLEKSKSTSFCLSCHVMEPYGQSLWLEDSDYLPAAHFQNNRVEREHACFTCHTTYTMFGDVKAKMAGFKHLFINYLGTIPDTIELYQPYENRECLHCHEGARSYLDMHEDFVEELESGETSCLECHDMTHPVKQLTELETWKEPGS